MPTTWICVVDCFTGERLAYPETLISISFDARRAYILATCEENRTKNQEEMIRAQYRGLDDETPSEVVDKAIEKRLGKTKSRIKRLKSAEAMVLHHDKRMFVRDVTRVDSWEKVIEYTKSGPGATIPRELHDLASKDDYSAGAIDIDVEHEHPKPGDPVDESGDT